ncbi:hypothetical protein HIM_00832 [Hirsutella minnesotensis 3608]|nr:hypothetical protein HIM_00832 [Hirsutella minnesotensis 3608]
MGAPHHSTPRKARLRGAFDAAIALDLPVSKKKLFELHGVSRRTGNRILSDLAARRVEYAERALAARPKKEDWHGIFFSDETHFGYDDERTAYIARPRGTRDRPENLQEKRAPKDSEVKLLHAWACVGYDFKSPLIWYEVSSNSNGKMSQKVYLEKILKGYIGPELLEKGVSFILEEDGDSGHGPGKNNPVRTWKEEHGLKYFFNCASSPDLSPIENC